MLNPDLNISPGVRDGAASNRSEADVRAIRARRAGLEQALRAEGQSEATIARLATDEMAEKLIEQDQFVLNAITDAAFGGRGLG